MLVNFGDEEDLQGSPERATACCACCGRARRRRSDQCVGGSRGGYSLRLAAAVAHRHLEPPPSLWLRNHGSLLVQSLAVRVTGSGVRGHASITGANGNSEFTGTGRGHRLRGLLHFVTFSIEN